MRHPYAMCWDVDVFSRLKGVFSRVVYLQQWCDDGRDEDQDEDLVHVVFNEFNLYEKKGGNLLDLAIFGERPAYQSENSVWWRAARQKNLKDLIIIVANKNHFEYRMSQLPAGSDFRFSKLRTTIIYCSHIGNGHGPVVLCRVLQDHVCFPYWCNVSSCSHRGQVSRVSWKW